METIKKRILIICPFALPNLGGVESHISKLLKYSSIKGFYPVLLTYQPLTRKVKGLAHEKTLTHEIYRVPWFGNGWFTKLEPYFPLTFLYLFPGLFLFSLFYFLVHKNSFKTIHAHGLIAALITRVLSFVSKKHTVVSTHAVYSFENRKLLGFLVKKILEGFDKILAVSEVSKQELQQMGISQDKLLVHPNWVETDVFTPTQSKFSISDTNTNVLFFGRLIEKKGIKIFLEAAKSFKDKITFHVAGGGPMQEYVLEVSQTLPNVIYHGTLMQNEPTHLGKLLSLLQNCNYVISPYLYDEGFSTTLIESLSCGTPVIITDRGSPPTFLTKDVAIFLSSNPTSDELVKVLQSMPRIDSKTCRVYAETMFGYTNANVIINTYE